MNSPHDLTPEQIKSFEDSWIEFENCEHQWVDEPADSLYYRLCSTCGAAEGLKLPEWMWS